MFLCYLDESGTPEPQGASRHFVLLGLAIPADSWKEKDRQVSAVKSEFRIPDAEIHTAWMLRDYPEQARIPGFESMCDDERRRAVFSARVLNLARGRRARQQRELTKNYRKTEPYVHLTRRERQACVERLADLVGSWPDCRLFAEAQDKHNLADTRLFDIAFEQVVTRFNTFLSLAAGQNGLLVQDNNETICRRLTENMRRYHRDGTLWADIDNIVETPLFVDSALTSMVQLADLCAYATRRRFDNREFGLFNRVAVRFDRHRGRLVGLRHFTGQHRCRCRVCREHGRYTMT